MGSNPTNLPALNRRLAYDSRRVSELIDTLSGQIDALVAAAESADWGEIRRKAAEMAVMESDPVVAEAARQVAAAADRPHAELPVRRALMRLIGAYGRISIPR
jgi:hypothetical protein